MEGIYYEIYTMLQNFIYGSSAVLTPDMSLALTLVSTLVCLLAVSVPFIVVFYFIKVVLR